MVMPSTTNFDLDLLVEDLLEDNKICWDRMRVQELFNLEEAKTILAIPVSKFGLNNVLVWHFDNKGVYLVKSGYRLLCS
ncbi:hypothetical protein REPUB_Repub14bG0040000 [Reevesia pubescens]